MVTFKFMTKTPHMHWSGWYSKFQHVDSPARTSHGEGNTIILYLLLYFKVNICWSHTLITLDKVCFTYHISPTLLEICSVDFCQYVSRNSDFWSINHIITLCCLAVIFDSSWFWHTHLLISKFASLGSHRLIEEQRKRGFLRSLWSNLQEFVAFFLNNNSSSSNAIAINFLLKQRSFWLKISTMGTFTGCCCI